MTKSGAMATINPLRYRGYYYDEESGYYYLQTRYYDPVVGRFINADDPGYLGATDTVLGYNLYSYCENSPMNYVDGSGCVPAEIALNAAYFRRTSRRVYSKMVSCLSGGFIYRIGFSALFGSSGCRQYAKVLDFTINVVWMFRAYKVSRVEYCCGSSNIGITQRISGRTTRTYFKTSAPSKWKTVNTVEYEDFRSMVGVSVTVYFQRGTAEYKLYFIYTLAECEFILSLKNSRGRWITVEFA